MSGSFDLNATAESVVSIVRSVVGDNGSSFIPLHEPEFAGEEWDMVRDCLDSGWVSSVGKYVDRFEAQVAELCGARHGVAVVNGTAALQIALQVAGVRSGDEVLMPALTFVATANAASHLGALPHFVDCAPDTLGLDPAALADHMDRIAEIRGDVVINRETGRRLSAIVAMHTFGHPVDMDGLAELAGRWNLPLVEDAAEALGSRYKGQACGGLGRIGAVSFNGNKIVTTGGGGAIVTNDPELALRAKHLTTTAKVPHRWEFDHDEVGYNYRLPNINAALGCAQLQQLPERLSRKRKLAHLYIEAFKDCNFGRMFKEMAWSESNYWLNTLLLAPEHADERDAILTSLNTENLMARPAWTAMHRLSMYKDAPRSDLGVTENLVARIINLPSSAKLGA